MWKDGSAVFPNKAARALMFRDNEGVSSSAVRDGFDMLPQWSSWNEDFTKKLTSEEFPISILIRTETPFSNMRVGMYRPDGTKVVYDVLGEAIRDDTTGEFLAGVVTCRDVTPMTEEMTHIKERDEEREERFRLICDTMPQMVWTATPDGMHDYFNSGWYDYTGLTPEESMGQGWQTPFHPDDLAEAGPRWLHAREKGTPYEVEYRCRSKDGEWRWFLGRAAPARNKETGVIEKWFGKFEHARHDDRAADFRARYLYRYSRPSPDKNVCSAYSRTVTECPHTFQGHSIHSGHGAPRYLT
jgi:PAS domain S-box-containing protein